MKTKIISIFCLLIVINMIFFNINRVQAATSDVFTDGDSFIQKGTSELNKNNIIDGENLKDASTTIYNILLGVGIALSVIIISILGIKFMMGSVEEKAEVKETLVPFIVGCVVVFAAFAIWKIFVLIGNGL